MECYESFPRTTVLYNLLTLGGAMVVGVIVLAQLGIWAMIGYLVLLALAYYGVLALVCTRCYYYDRRCATGIGKVAALFLRKGREEEFGQTAAQKVALLLLGIALLLPLLGGIVSLLVGYSTLRLVLLVALLALLVAALAPHPGLVCGHCKLAEKGCCPIGRLVVRNQ
ncbi:MAG TPA: hypothetical protein EYP49_09510 [Anaerolineae bacterium]|nr:hypothetical protein [Anaerolineae bacterium]